MRRILLPFLALAWLLLALGLYYAGHKPADPEPMVALALVVWRIFIAAAEISLAGGLGALLLRGDRPALHPLARLAFQAGLGLGLIALAVLGLGVTVGLPGWLPWAGLGLLTALLWRPAWGWLKGWSALGDLWRESGGFERLLAVLLALIFGMTLWVALAPPVQYDSLVYHLVLPAAYLQQGRVEYLPWTIFSGMPQAAEMLYTWVIPLAGGSGAAVLGWGTGFLAAVGLLGLLRQAWDARAAWVGTAALLAGFTPAWLLAGGYVDWLAFLEALGALAMLAAWRVVGDRRELLWAGAFTGLAIGCKYTSGVAALAGLGVLAWHAWKRRAAFLPAALAFGLAALAPALPWLVKNVATTGNPFYPFFFGGGAMNAIRQGVYQSLPPWGSWLDFVFLPLRATALGFESGDGYMFAAGWLLLGLGGLAWLAHKTSPEPSAGEDPGEARSGALLSSAVLLGAGGLLLWALGNRYSGNLIQTRYYFTIFPAFAALAAAGEVGLRRLRLGQARLGRLAAVLIALALGLNSLEVSLAALRNGAPQAALGLKSQEAYLADALGWFQPVMRAVRELPENKRVQLIYENRSYYCLPRCRGDVILDEWKQEWTARGDQPDAIRADWRSRGITHLLVNRQGMRFLLEALDPHHPPSDLDALDRFLASLPAPVDYGGVYELYSLE